MTDLLSLTAPIFLLMAIGFAAVRARLAPLALVEALGFFVLHFALPALILHALLSQDLRQTFNWSYIFAYAVGSLAVFAAALLLFRTFLSKPLSEAAMAALGSSAANSGFIGFPLVSLALGAPALVALPLSMLVENILIIPLALALAEIGRQEGQTLAGIIRHTAGRLARTPFLLAIPVGVILSAFGLHPPQPLATAIEMMADASVPCALFVVGGTLATLRASSVAGDVLWIVLGKLVLHPLAVAAAFMLIGGVPADLMAAGIIMASAPMLTIYPILAGRFGHGEMGAAALLAATMLSFATLAVVLALVLPEASGQSMWYSFGG